MQVLRALTALDESSAQHSSLAEGQLLPMLVCTLAMLAALNPIQPPRRHSKALQASSGQTLKPAPSVESLQPTASAHHDTELPDELSQGIANAQSHQTSAATSSSQNLDSQIHKSSSSTARCISQPSISQRNGVKAALSTQPQNCSVMQSSQLQQQNLSAPASTLPASGSTSDHTHAELPAHLTQVRQTDTCGSAVEHSLREQCADSPEDLLKLARQYPKQSPYQGYRCDLVALLANLCFRRTAVQKKVQQLGGVELILSQCQVHCLPRESSYEVAL